MKKKRSSQKTIKTFDKYGKFIAMIPYHVAEFSVKSDKSSWIDSTSIQILYHKKDERAFKQEVLKRDDYTCYLCGEKLYKGHPEVTVDHVVPKRLGGSILPANMKCSCRTCNEQKGHRTFAQYFFAMLSWVLFMVLWWRNKMDRSDPVDQKETKKEEKTYRSHS